MCRSDPAFDTTGNTQLAVGDNSCIFSFDTSIVAVSANKTTNTGDRSSVFASIAAGPLVVLGPAAPMDGGSFGVSMSTPGPTHSQASRASAYLDMDSGSHEALDLEADKCLLSFS